MTSSQSSDRIEKPRSRLLLSPEFNSHMTDADQESEPALTGKGGAGAKGAKEGGKKHRKRRKRAKTNTATAQDQKRIGTRGPRPFPSDTLQEAIKVADVIRTLNGGNPWAPPEVANALELSSGGNRFFYLTSSARLYGLTLGTREAKVIELGPLGRKILYATSSEIERVGLFEAFSNVEVFKKVYEYYSGNALPELKYLGNTLESVFGVAPEYHEEFIKVYTANLEFLKSSSALANPAGGAGRSAETPLVSSAASRSIVVGQPQGSNKSLLAFVIIPFGEKTAAYPLGFFEEVLTNLITPAAIEAGFRVETARREGSDVIHSTIVNDLLAADLVIADLTEHNPNVLFELGLRMAFEKPTALIRARGTLPIFDVDNLLRVYDYDPNLWRSSIDLDLPKLSGHIKGTWDSRDTGPTYMKLLKR